MTGGSSAGVLHKSRGQRWFDGNLQLAVSLMHYSVKSLFGGGGERPAREIFEIKKKGLFYLTIAFTSFGGTLTRRTFFCVFFVVY